MQFTAKINHTRESCLKLAQVQNTCFGKSRDRIRFILALVLFLLGCTVGPKTILGSMLVICACIFYYKTSSMYKEDAKVAYDKTPKRFLKVEYEFNDSSLRVLSGNIEKEVRYGDMRALISDGDCAYIFINNYQAYMLDLQTLIPNKVEEFYLFVQCRANLPWKKVNVYRRFSFWNFLKKNGRGEAV